MTESVPSHTHSRVSEGGRRGPGQPGVLAFGSRSLGVQPRGPPTVAERTPGQSDVNDATLGMRVAGNQGQGSGHNGAIVGLQSVDFQAAVPFPPSLLLTPPSARKSPKPAFLRASAPRDSILAATQGARPSHYLILPPGGDRTPHFRERGARQGPQLSLILAGDSALPVLFQSDKTQSNSLSFAFYCEVKGPWDFKTSCFRTRQNGTFPW